MIAWVQMDEAASTGLSAGDLAHLFSEFGDFNVYKDSQSSFFMEFYYLEPSIVPSQTIPEFINVLTTGETARSKNVKAAVEYKDATKFKAHNRLE